MLKKFKEIYKITAAANNQSISIKRKLILYWFSMALVIFAVIMLILTLTGVFSRDASNLSGNLKTQQKNTFSDISRQIEIIRSSGVKLSGQISNELDNILMENSETFKGLNDNPKLLKELQSRTYDLLYDSMQEGSCSGAFAVFDVTTNTTRDIYGISRSGIYLRLANLNTTDSKNQKIAYFRGIPDIARAKNIELHNRWNLEFDVSAMPGYYELMSKNINRLAEEGIWSGKVKLKDTWEDVMLLYVPILDSEEKPCGICGIEISDLYFSLSNPVVESEYGNMTTVIAPVRNNKVLMRESMIGDMDGTVLDSTDKLDIKEKKHFNVYSTKSSTYLGQHNQIIVNAIDNKRMVVATLISKNGYKEAITEKRIFMIIVSAAFLMLALIMAFIFSKMFIKPITKNIESVKTNPSEIKHTGFSEIDELLEFLRMKESKGVSKEETLPHDIEEMFKSFAERVHGLSAAERGVFKYYVEGHQICEIPDLAFVSMSTVRKHNSNIYKKLGVKSWEEMMLYIEMFRRSERLNEIYNCTEDK